MDFAELKNLAEELSADLKQLSKYKLYVCANACQAEGEYPNRIIVEGIKNLRTTGRFTLNDRNIVNTKLFDFCNKYRLEVKVLDSDSGMHNAVIVCKKLLTSSLDSDIIET